MSRLKKYTDPAFFFNIWAAELMKKIDKANEQIDNKKVQQLSSLELLIIFVQFIKSSKVSQLLGHRLLFSKAITKVLPMDTSENSGYKFDLKARLTQNFICAIHLSLSIVLIEVIRIARTRCEIEIGFF